MTFAMVRKSTRIMLSTGQKTMISPGPLGLGIARPKRKITPRWYSFRTRIQVNRYRTTRARALPRPIAVSIIHMAGTSQSGWPASRSLAGISISLPLRNYTEPLNQAAVVAHQVRDFLLRRPVEVSERDAHGTQQGRTLDECLGLAVRAAHRLAASDEPAWAWMNDRLYALRYLVPDAHRSLSSIAGKFLGADVVVIDSCILEYLVHGFDHALGSSDVVDRRKDSLQVLCQHLRVDHAPLALPGAMGFLHLAHAGNQFVIWVLLLQFLEFVQKR